MVSLLARVLASGLVGQTALRGAERPASRERGYAWGDVGRFPSGQAPVFGRENELVGLRADWAECRQSLVFAVVMIF